EPSERRRRSRRAPIPPSTSPNAPGTESALSANSEGRLSTLGAAKAFRVAGEPIASWIIGVVIRVQQRSERQAPPALDRGQGRRRGGALRVGGQPDRCRLFHAQVRGNPGGATRPRSPAAPAAANAATSSTASIAQPEHPVHLRPPGPSLARPPYVEILSHPHFL